MKPKKIRPMFTSIITTMDKYDAPVINDAGLIDTSKKEGAIKEFQKVLAIGSAVKNVNVGDIICVNPANYAVRKYKEGSFHDGVQDMNPVTKFIFKTVELAEEGECLILDERDVLYVVESFDEEASE